MLNALKISKHLLILCLCIAGIESCYAAVFGINNNTDSELRNAINSANANGAGTDTINFFNKGTVTLSSALPNITSSLYIQGLRANLSIIRAASTPGSSGYRVFNVTANVTVTINDVSIANGYITSGNGAGIATTTGDLYINDCMFIDNRALGSSNTGGAIDAQGNLYVTRSSFINNRHATNGGAVGWHPGSSKTAEFTNVTFSGNIGSSSQANHGGGAFSAFSFSGTHTLKFINCTFKDNVLNGSTPNNGKSIFVAAIGSTFNTTLLNSVLADAATGNYATYLQSGGSVPLSRTYTVASDASMAAAGAGNVNSAGAIGIDTLDFHGGTTRLYSILETSILVDAGTSTGTPDEDQRRVPKSGNKDIGSFEYFEQACDTPVFASTYVRDYANRLYTFTNVNINSAGNVAFVNPGQNVNITFNYSISQNGGFCPGCVVQMYWGIAGYYGICERSFGGYCNCSGSVNRTFTAPNQAGIYYFTTGGSLQFSCQPNPQNFLSASATVAFGAIIVGTPVNGSLVSITGQNESCFTGNDSLFTNAVVGYTCTGVNLTSFEWFKDSVAIPASNVENLPIYDEGVYHVRWFNNINESVFSDTFVVNSIVRGFNSPTALGLSIVDDTLNIQGDTAQVLLLNTQLGAKYVLVDTSSGTAYTDTLNGNGGSLSFNFVPVQGVDFGFFATRQGCSKVLDSTFQIYFNTPPLNGTYTIGQDTSFDYSSINSAISDAYLKGVSGDVIFTIDSGTYNEQFIIHGDSIVGLAEERSITFIPVAGAEGMVLVSDTASGMADNYVLQLNKAHHLNFHGIRFKANNNSFGRVVDFEGANYSIEFTHNVFEGVTATGSSFNTGLLIADGGGGIRLDSFLIYGNTFIKGNYGFLLRDNSGFTYLNNTIDSNRFVDFGYAGVFIQGNRNLVLENNYFNDRGGSSLIYSIYLGNNDRTTVRNNRIINQSSSAAYGVYTVNMLAGAGVPSVIANNSISLINSNGGTTRGIHAQNNRNTQVYNNSIYNNCPSAVNGRGIYFTGPGAYTGNIFKNNNIVFDGPGACFEATSFSTGGIDDIQNNNYYTNGSTLGIWNGVARANLTAWLSATGDDSGSVSFDPYYTSDTLLLPTGLYFNDKGQTVLSELVDIQGLSRDSTTCDIGAYEYSPPFPPGEYVYELGAGNAVELDGVNDYLDMSITNLPQGNAPRSLEVWMRMDGSPSAVSTLFNWGAPVNNQRSGLKVQPDGTVQFVANGFANDVFGTEVVTDGRWHHIAAVYDGTWVSLYIDGVLDVDALRNLNTTGTTLRVGEIVGSSGVAYEGGIDEVRIWDKALTQSELREYMCQRLSRNHPSIDNLITYIPFDEGSGDKILDIAQGVTGTFSNVDTTSLWRKSGASLGDSSVYFYDDLNMS